MRDKYSAASNPGGKARQDPVAEDSAAGVQEDLVLVQPAPADHVLIDDDL